MLVLFETVNQPGFEPGSRGPKLTLLNIEQHSIDKKNLERYVS